MEFFLVVLGVIAIVAFVRASNLRKELDAHLQEYLDKVTDLTGEIFEMRQTILRFRSLFLPKRCQLNLRKLLSLLPRQRRLLQQARRPERRANSERQAVAHS